jgi:hypothetical protein
MNKQGPRKTRIAIFCEDESTLRLLAKVASKKGYDVVAQPWSKDCVVVASPGGACTRKERCADIFICGRHFGPYKGFDFLQAQVKAGCRLTMENKLVLCSIFDAADARRAEELGVKMMHLSFAVKELSAWLAERENG